MAKDKVLHLDSSNFDATLQGDRPVLVDFWAPWCGPCRAVAPILDELAEEHEDRLTVAKVNIDEQQDLAARFGVTGIPMFLLVENGEVKDQIVGARPKRAFNSFLAEHLS